MDGMIGSVLQVTLSNGAVHEGTLTSINFHGNSPTMRLQTHDSQSIELKEDQITDIVMLKDASQGHTQENGVANFKQPAREQPSDISETTRHAKSKRSERSERSSKNVSQFDQRKQPEKARTRNEAVNTESTWMSAKFDGEFDFDMNLALFDKQAVYEEIDRGRSGTQSDSEASRYKQTHAAVSTHHASKKQPQMEVTQQERHAFSQAFARLPSVKDGQVYGAQNATFFVRKSESEHYDQTLLPGGLFPNVLSATGNAAEPVWLTPAGLRVCTVDRAMRDRLIEAACEHFGTQAVIETVGLCVSGAVLEQVLRNEFTVRCTSSSNSNGSVRNSPYPFAPPSSNKRSNSGSKTAQSAAAQTGSSKRRCVVLVLARANLRGAIALNCARHLATRHVDCTVLYFDDDQDVDQAHEEVRRVALAQLDYFEEADGKTARTLDDIRALQLDSVDCVVNALLDGDVQNASMAGNALSETTRAILRWCDAHVGNAQQLLVDPPGDFDKSPELAIARQLATATFSLTFGALDALLGLRCATQSSEDASAKRQDTAARSRSEKRSSSQMFGTLLFADAGFTKRIYELAGFTFFQSPFAFTHEPFCCSVTLVRRSSARQIVKSTFDVGAQSILDERATGGKRNQTNTRNDRAS